MDARRQALAAVLEFWEAAGVDVAEAWAKAAPGPQAAPGPARPRAPVRPPPEAGPAAEAEALAAGAATLEALAAAIAAFDGCSLKRGARQAVVYDGVPGAPVLLIGEAPGAEEDRLGRPFVGRSGQLLDLMLAAIGVSRTSNVLITNTVFWRPPANRAPAADETAACAPFLARLVALTAPRAVILCGGVAAKAVLRRDEAVGRLRGRRQALPQGFAPSGVDAMVMFHPSFLLRRPQDKRHAWADLLAIEAWLDSLGVQRNGAG